MGFRPYQGCRNCLGQAQVRALGQVRVWDEFQAVMTTALAHPSIGLVVPRPKHSIAVLAAPRPKHSIAVLTAPRPKHSSGHMFSHYARHQHLVTEHSLHCLFYCKVWLGCSAGPEHHSK